MSNNKKHLLPLALMVGFLAAFSFIILRDPPAAFNMDLALEDNQQNRTYSTITQETQQAQRSPQSSANNREAYYRGSNGEYYSEDGEENHDSREYYSDSGPNQRRSQKQQNIQRGIPTNETAEQAEKAEQQQGTLIASTIGDRTTTSSESTATESGTSTAQETTAGSQQQTTTIDGTTPGTTTTPETGDEVLVTTAPKQPDTEGGDVIALLQTPSEGDGETVYGGEGGDAVAEGATDLGGVEDDCPLGSRWDKREKKCVSFLVLEAESIVLRLGNFPLLNNPALANATLWAAEGTHSETAATTFKFEIPISMLNLPEGAQETNLAFIFAKTEGHMGYATIYEARFRLPSEIGDGSLLSATVDYPVALSPAILIVAIFTQPAAGEEYRIDKLVNAFRMPVTPVALTYQYRVGAEQPASASLTTSEATEEKGGPAIGTSQTPSTKESSATKSAE